VDYSNVKRVLLIRPNFRMGNLLITTSALPTLRANFPEATLEMLCPATFSGLLRHHPDLDRVHTFTRMDLFLPWRLWGLRRRLRREGYDLVIDGTVTGSATLLVLLSGGRVRLGAPPRARRFAYTSVVPQPPRGVWRVEAIRLCLESMGLKVPERAAMKIGLSDEEREAALRSWGEFGFTAETEVTGIFIGARGDKVWPLERWAAVINALWKEKKGTEGLVVFHGDEERGKIGTLRSQIPTEVPVSCTPSVRDFAARVSLCRQFVTCDTGPMHLAAALGVPVVSLFFRKSWRRFAPQGPHDVVVHDAAMPTPEKVIDAVRRQREAL
jgi:heptosyltransferase-3